MPKKQPINEREEVLKALDDSNEEENEHDEKEQPEEEKGDEQESSANQDTEGKKESNSRSAATGKKGKKEAPKLKNASQKSPTKPPPDKEPQEDRKQGKNRKLIILITVLCVVLVGVAVGGYFMFGRSDNDETTTNSAVVSTDTVKQLVARRIDGVLDSPQNQNKFPVAIMVENYTAARPQSGLTKANIVYEALAEGGITRFLAIFTITSPVKEIGPVRSARPYYVDWARAYNALYVHIGGSPKALARISQTGIRDFNQFFNSQYFWRDKTRDVASEHTLYTSDYLMSLALIDKKIPTTGDFEPWKYKQDALSSERQSSQHITINFSTFSYKVDYEYDPVQNDYVRSVAEKPHVMRDGEQLRPKNVVVITVNRRLEQPVTGNHGRLEMDTVGQGTAQFFLDGTVLKGTWKKDSPQDPLQLLKDDGTPVELNAGQTWVEVVPPDQQVTVK
ncbi:MAG: DUF3048 domain-containing protein [Candidatus Kerfeldbacteria bacterium]